MVADITDVAETATRRERKKLATNVAIRQAALELMGERGFAAVTVEEICDRADVATSTFFRHFATKEDVVLADFDERGRHLLAALDAQPEGVGVGDLLVGALQNWRLRRRPAAVLRVEVALLVAEPALQARLDRTLIAWEQPIAQRLATRYGADEQSLEVQLAAAWFVTAVRVVIRQWAVSGGEEDLFSLGRVAVGDLAGLLGSTLTR